jgi:hypothetical protein
MHFPWVDDEIIEIKRRRYAAIYGEEYENFDPKRFGGNLLRPPEWLKE